MARLLVSHPLDVRAVLSSEASIGEVLSSEDGKTIVEKVELDPLLVETKGDGLEVEIRVDLVTREGTVGTSTTEGSVWSRLGVSQLAISVVISGSWVERERRDRGGGGSALEGTSGGRDARVGSVTS